ncbi:hypothetical protein MUP32_01775 [Candidatus Microgenomates bacterium]|nr:hypothetical protein [Candidatus Microgenomates bacterium]
MLTSLEAMRPSRMPLVVTFDRVTQEFGLDKNIASKAQSTQPLKWRLGLPVLSSFLKELSYSEGSLNSLASLSLQVQDKSSEMTFVRPSIYEFFQASLSDPTIEYQKLHRGELQRTALSPWIITIESFYDQMTQNKPMHDNVALKETFVKGCYEYVCGKNGEFQISAYFNRNFRQAMEKNNDNEAVLMGMQSRMTEDEFSATIERARKKISGGDSAQEDLEMLKMGGVDPRLLMILNSIAYSYIDVMGTGSLQR